MIVSITKGITRWAPVGPWPFSGMARVVAAGPRGS